MSKLFRTLLSITLGCAAMTGAAETGKTTVLLPVPHAGINARRQEAAATRPGASKRGTPLEKIFLPHLQQRLSAAGQSRNGLDAKPFDAGQTNIVPNFGGFLNSKNYPARLESSCIVDPYNCGVNAALTADFDKDGKPDIAIVQSDGTLNVMLNSGSGFGSLVAYTNPNYSTTYAQQSFLADVNHDGYPDVVVLDAGNDAFIVYPNLKNGTFGTPTATSFSIPGNLASVAIGDVNNDGFPDIVAVAFNAGFTGSSMTVSTFLGNGDLTFKTPSGAQTQTYTFPGAPQLDLSIAALALGDLNKDGKLDLAIEYWEYVSSGTVTVTTSLGNGDGTFSALNTNAVISGTFQPGIFNPFDGMSQGGVQIADVNNDGNLDITAEGDGVLLVALGTGSGGFSSTAVSSPIGGADQYVFADVNGDGIPDLIQENGTLGIWTGKGDGTFWQPPTGNFYTIDAGGYESAMVADFDGDGKVDIGHLGEDYKQVSIFTGNGTTTLAAAPALASSLVTPVSPFWLSLGTVADVQGKGFSSAVYIDDYTGDIVTGLGDGKGNFTYVTGLAQATVPNLAYIEPITADLNGDGKQDLLLAGWDGSLSMALSNGDGTYQTPKSLGITSACEIAYAAVGDINGDGIPDIVAPYPGDSICSGTVTTGSGYYVLLGQGNGSYAAPVFNAYGTELYSASIADMNGDGKMDLVVDDTPFYTPGTFSVDLLPGNGDGTFGNGITINSNYMVSQVIVGDFNQDGKQDVILLSDGEQTATDAYTTAGILLIPGNGDGTFNVPTQIGTGNFFLNGTLTDVNNDGIPDLNVALYQTIGQPNTYYGLSTLLGTGGGAFTNPINQLESLNSEMVFAGNFYSDNAADLIVQTGYGPGLFLGQGGSSIALTSSGSSIAFGTAETLTATITAAMTGRPAPTGTVWFYDGTTQLGSGSLSGGVATFVSSTLAVGAHSITAVYAGDTNSNPVTSTASAMTVTTLAPAFTLTNASTMTLTPGQTGVMPFSLAANATFNDTINFTCSGAPVNATCTVNPTSVALAAGGTGSVSLVVSATTSTTASNTQPSLLQKASGITSLASIFCLVAGWKFRKRVLLIVPIVLLGFSALGMTGCTGGGSGIAVAKAGTYTLTVTATPATNTTAVQTATITLTVQSN
ncbi:FG-GAP-like repeat-containing protein [Terracidiphilus gabretensis]|uniref:FG-GAP-like repeat-containing protein n=1 Tax=Terracidiphilus gabretensis TaxID=1577687 RepID=UPI00071B57F6|nr:FG-GAP-like repeat-containing protein [Terracidiphilus gabretensis]